MRKLIILLVLTLCLLPNLGSAQTYDWTQVNTNGFGDKNNARTTRSAVYQGRLYLGTTNRVTGGEVWAYDGTNWNQVNVDGFGDLNNIEAFSLAVYQNRLFVGTVNQISGCEIWAYDGTNWSQVNVSGFGDSTNGAAYSMAVYHDFLYVGTAGNDGCQVWQYDGTEWIQVGDTGFGKESHHNYWALSMAVFDGRLYVGTNDGCEVWAYNGTDWTQVNLNHFGDATESNSMLFSMAVWNNHLYAAATNATTGCEVWKYNGGTDWTQVNVNGFGDSSNYRPPGMGVFSNRLYVGTGYYSKGAKLWEYDGTNWLQRNPDAFGNSLEAYTLATYNQRFYVGTHNSQGAKVYTPAEIPVQIDNNPGSYHNALNPHASGVIPVVILGSEDFDVSQVDFSTLNLAGLTVKARKNGTLMCSIEDVSGDFTSPEGGPDGFPDLVCHFQIDSEAWSPDNGTATITGTMLDGTPFRGTVEISQP